MTLDLKSNSEIHRRLEASKVAIFTPLGSLAIDPANFRIKSEVTDTLYTCGHPTFGTLLAVNFVISIATQSQKVMIDIVKRLNEGPKL